MRAHLHSSASTEIAIHTTNGHVRTKYIEQADPQLFATCAFCLLDASPRLYIFFLLSSITASTRVSELLHFDNAAQVHCALLLLSCSVCVEPLAAGYPFIHPSIGIACSWQLKTLVRSSNASLSQLDS